MPKRLTISAFFQRLPTDADRRTAKHLLMLGDDIGAVGILGKAGVAVKLRVPGEERGWLSLFVIATSGRFYASWTERWTRIGAPKRIGIDYERALKSALRAAKIAFNPGHHPDAIPLSVVERNFPKIERALSLARRHLTPWIEAEFRRAVPANAASVTSALEGVVKDARLLRGGRNRRLRDAAMTRARGVCRVCRVDYSRTLSGEGVRVLQVHHLQQIGGGSGPRTTRLQDLVVVCANCHVLLHMDRERPLTPSELRARLRVN